jgi:hypothetical protein
VRGSHCGLGHNASVLAVVVDRLARARSEWQPFVPPSTSRSYFPEPTSWEAVSQFDSGGRTRRRPERATIH